MKVIITGITGFIGAELAHKLIEEGHEIYGFMPHIVARDWASLEDIKDKIHVVVNDVRDYHNTKDSIKKIGPDVVFHLAALSPVRLSFENPIDFHYTNFIGTINIAEAIRDLYGNDKVRLIVASTAEVYGIQEPKPFTEDLKLEPSSPYAVSKAALDMYIRMLFKVYDFNGVVLRNSNTFGRKYDNSFFTEAIIFDMLLGKDIYIGAPDSIRSYMYIDDHINGYLLAMKRPEAKGEVFNISGHKGYTNKEWILKIAETLDFPKEKIHFGEYPPGYPIRPIKSDQPYLVLDTSKAQRILGWQQTVSPEEGLKKTINHWRNKTNLKRNSLSNLTQDKLDKLIEGKIKSILDQKLQK